MLVSHPSDVVLTRTNSGFTVSEAVADLTKDTPTALKALTTGLEVRLLFGAVLISLQVRRDRTVYISISASVSTAT